MVSLISSVVSSPAAGITHEVALLKHRNDKNTHSIDIRDDSAPAFVTQYANTTLTRCLPSPSNSNQCSVSYHTASSWASSSATSYGKLHLFNHDCVVIGQNNSVTVPQTLAGFDFFSELPSDTIVRVDLDPWNLYMHADYADRFALL